MKRQECKDCGCSKSEHMVKLCRSCLLIYQDNYKEYMLDQYNVKPDKKFISPWHKFKLDNLKYLEQCYEGIANG